MKQNSETVELKRVPDPASQGLTTRGSGLGNILFRILLMAEATPIPRPSLPVDFQELSALLRIYESLRYSLLDLEYSLTPAGELRGLAKFSLKLSLMVIILALGLLATLGCASLVLGMMVVITGQIVALLWNIFLGLLAILAICVLVFVIIAASAKAKSHLQRR